MESLTDPSVWHMPWELEIVLTGRDRVPGGIPNTMTLGGAVLLTEEYLDMLQTIEPGGFDKVDVRELQATAVIRSGASGSDVTLVSQSIPYTCALGNSIPCDPANDLAGIAGHRGNTDCTPIGSWNTCGRFVDLPTSSDCDTEGVCSIVDDWRNIKQTQCTNNGFCVTGRLGLQLEEQATTYLPYRKGKVTLGWDDKNTGATVQLGGPNDGTWILPAPVYSNPPGPNGLRLIFSNSMSGQNEDVAFECTMGVDSQGRHGVYSADPLSSPTPDYTAEGNNEVLLSTLYIFSTGHMADSIRSSFDQDVCLHVDSEATMLTPSPLCDIDDTGASHAFQFRYDSSCSFGIDRMQNLSIDPGGNFGLNTASPSYFGGSLLMLPGHSPAPASGVARDDMACTTTAGWGARLQPIDLPNGGTCDESNEPCSLGCDSVGCFQYCFGDGVECEMSCPGGSCTQLCELGATCTISCSEGCYQYCDDQSTCSTTCGNGTGADCTALCSGSICSDPGQCNTNECDPFSSCVTTPVADGIDCTVSGIAPGSCDDGLCCNFDLGICTYGYDGYVNSLGDGSFGSILLNGGGACCFETPYEAGISYPNLYVDPAFCDSYMEYVNPPTDTRLRLEFVTGGGACCFNTEVEVLAAYPTREICDGRSSF